MNETPIASRESVPTGQMESTETILREALTNADNALKICYADSHFIRTEWLRENGHEGIADVIDNIRKWSGSGCNERRLALSSVPEREGSPATIVPASPNSEDEKIARRAWDSIEHGLRYEGVSVGFEIILAAIKKAKAASDTKRPMASNEELAREIWLGLAATIGMPTGSRKTAQDKILTILNHLSPEATP